MSLFLSEDRNIMKERRDRMAMTDVEKDMLTSICGHVGAILDRHVFIMPKPMCC